MCPAEQHTEATGAPISVIGRVSAILGAFESGPASLGIREIARRTGIAPSSVSRLVAELVAFGFLERSSDGFGLGLRFFELGETTTRPRTLRRLTYAHLERLRYRTSCTAHLAVLSGSDVVYIDILPARDSPRMASRVGGRVPAHATAVGKALLAHSSASVVEAAVGGGLARLGPNTITDSAALDGELALIREAGLSRELEESGTDVACVAAPIVVGDGEPLCAISVSGRPSSFDWDAFGDVVREAATSITRAAKALPHPARRL